ncbi:MAG: copper chaperone PCu(A)C [Paracoccaceae bacterium]
MRNWFAAMMVGVVLVPWAARADSDIQISGVYALVTSENAPSAAIFMEIGNVGAVDDRLLAVETDVADKAELHTHAMSADGLMQMLPVEGGLAVAAGASHALARGGDHVMLMGLRQAMPEGEKFTLTLTFEEAGKVVVVVPVQDAPSAEAGATMDHRGHGSATPASE